MVTKEILEIESDSYVLIPILQMLKNPDSFKNVSTYIKVLDKYIQLNYAEDSYEVILSSLLSKGATHVYLTTHDMAELLHIYQQRMIESDESFNEAVSRDLHVKENETVMMLAQAFIRNSGLSPQVRGMVESSNRRVQEIFKGSPNFKALLDKFKRDSSEEFFKITFTNCVCGLILNNFPWKTPLILDKLMLASTLCDLCLNAIDIADLEAYENENGPLTENVKNHSFNVINMIKADPSQISLETVTIIKQHHERPDGKGFPLGLDHTKINVLSTIFIVAHKFVDKISEAKNESNTYLDVAEEIRREYTGGNFTKTSMTLVNEIAKLK